MLLIDLAYSIQQQQQEQQKKSFMRKWFKMRTK